MCICTCSHMCILYNISAPIYVHIFLMIYLSLLIFISTDMCEYVRYVHVWLLVISTDEKNAASTTLTNLHSYIMHCKIFGSRFLNSDTDEDVYERKAFGSVWLETRQWSGKAWLLGLSHCQLFSSFFFQNCVRTLVKILSNSNKRLAKL
jgi:hypothetical protein